MQLQQRIPNSTQATGNTLHLVDMGINRIGKEGTFAAVPSLRIFRIIETPGYKISTAQRGWQRRHV
jgi:hypothetical protein